MKLYNKSHDSVFDVDEKGRTPLHMACEKGHVKTAKRLIRCSPNLNHK